MNIRRSSVRPSLLAVTTPTRIPNLLFPTAVSDRIFSTSVDLQYTFITSALQAFTCIDNVGAVDGAAQFNQVAASAKEVTLEVFATDESASVQVGALLLFIKIIIKTL
jgi:urate oxidase